jgi:putative salt-induced outer membrane protein YdiY
MLCGLAASAQTQPSLTLSNAPAPNPWVSSAAAGLTVTSGNSDSVQFNAEVGTERKWDKNEIKLGADALYGKADGKENANSIHAGGQYNRFVMERTYGYFKLDALHDEIADVIYRVTLSPGVGYYFIKQPKTTLTGEFGPGFITEKYPNSTPDSYATLRLAERLEHKVSDTAKVWEAVEVLPQIDKFTKNYIINAEIGAESAMSAKLALQLKAVDTYHSEPANGRKKNDLKLIAAVKYSF